MKYAVSKQLPMNKLGNCKKLFADMKTTSSELIDGKYSYKRTKVGESVEGLMEDADPESYIEPEYHRKNQQLFTWRFLNAVSYLDQSRFDVKTFNGDIDHVSNAILSANKKYVLHEIAKPVQDEK